jgi:type II secretory pathway component HofQ
MELKDAPVRTSLEMIFKQAGIKNYVIDNSVAGFVTMKLEDQPFENSLKLVMRANTIPLTYLKENDVWIGKRT